MSPLAGCVLFIIEAPQAGKIALVVHPRRFQRKKYELQYVGLSGRHQVESPKRRPKKSGSTAPVTAVGFASIDVEIRTWLEKRVLYAL
jgi:hypothetical protein